MLDAMTEHWERAGDCDRLHIERFQPIIGQGDGEHGEGGTIRFLDERRRGAQRRHASRSSSPARRPARRCPTAAGWASATPASGKLCSGKIRDLRTGEVSGCAGEIVRTCVNAPEGPIEIAL